MGGSEAHGFFGLSSGDVTIVRDNGGREARVTRVALLTRPIDATTIAPCVLRFSEKSPTSKLSPLDQAFGKSHDCGESTGAAGWRKRKGIARVRLSDGTICLAEIHWYEAAGIGRKEFKIKRLF